MITDTQQLPAPTSAFGAGTESVAIINIVDSGAGGGGGPQFAQGRILRGYVNVTLGAGGTSFSLKVRQGTTVAGAQVGTTDVITLPVANTPVSVPFCKQDLSASGAAAYCLTITGTGGTATVNDGNLTLEVPAPYGNAE